METVNVTPACDTASLVSLDLAHEDSAKKAFETLVTHNAALTRTIGQALKKKAGKPTTRQSYVGTGSASHRRQLWVRWEHGPVVDLWIEGTHVRVGGVVCQGGQGPTPHGKRVDTLDGQGNYRPLADVAADLVAILAPWAAKGDK